MYHLVRTGALCHECHYNVHSNVQAQNTIFGDGTGCVVDGTPPCPAGSAGLPPDAEDGVPDGVSDTHLINFAPGGPLPLYSGERTCADDTPLVADDPACGPGPQDPNPTLTDARINVFDGVEGVTSDRPVWYYQKTTATDTLNTFGVFRCNLRCHGVVMSTCYYITDRTIDENMNGPLTSGAATWCAGGQQQSAITFGAVPPAVKEFLAGLGQALTPPELATRSTKPGQGRDQSHGPHGSVARR
jgi:hypothetical protein